jgi:hypothetical protein
MRNHLWILLILPVLFVSCGKKGGGSGPKSGKAYSNQSTGASARDLLTDSLYTSLTIEVQYMQGYQPDAPALDQLRSFLEALLNKPAGISVTLSQIPSSGTDPLSMDDIRNIEKQYRTRYANGSELDVYVLYADAGFTDNSVLGVSYLNTSVCLFGKTIADNSGGIGQANRATLTATVLEHEMGHLLGLVNNGTPMKTPHEDQTHPAHCNNKDCLMYYAAETTDILGFLIAGGAPTLDANCRNDLRANGGK